MADKKKIIFLSIGIVLVGLLITGGTYAYFTFAANITNGNYASGSTCFDINYDITNKDGVSDISGTLFPSRVPRNGLGGDVSISMSDECNVSGKGNLYLNISSVASALTTVVSAHCENSITLETLSEHTTSSDCTAQANGVWVTSGTPLKYAVYDSISSNPVKVGYITGTGDLNVYSQFDVNHTKIAYTVYVWLDGNLVDNLDSSYSFSGYMHADVTQVE